MFLTIKYTLHLRIIKLIIDLKIQMKLINNKKRKNMTIIINKKTPRTVYNL